MSNTAKNLAAVIPQAKAAISIETRAIPTPGPGELLVRNRAVAANPVDHLVQDHGIFIEKYPIVVGSDVAGEVVSVGKSVTRLQPGDRVTGFAGSLYNFDIDHGGWQTYTILRELATTRLPDSISFEEGAVFPMAVATSGVGLFANLGLSRAPTQAERDAGIIFVWGASSSVGSMAVQIGHALGYTVFATASPRYHDWVKKLGASRVFDYNSPDIVDQVLAAAREVGMPVRYGYDAISKESTLDKVIDVVMKSTGKDGSGKVAHTLYWPEGKARPEGVDVDVSFAVRTGTDQTELGTWLFNEMLQKHLQNGSIVPAPAPEIVDGGIGAINKVFELGRAGVSGKKLVVQVQ